MTDSIFPDLNIERSELEKIGAELILASNSLPEKLAEEGRDSDAIINVYAQVPAEVINKLSKCKVIVRTGIGVNTIDVEAATKRSIMVANVPDYCLEEVADHTFSLFLACQRKICFLNNRIKNGNWNVNEAKPINRLKDRVFGLLGFGNIAKRVAVRAQAFNMKVLAFDPFMDKEIFAESCVEKTDDLNQLITQADYLSLHLPLTKDTKNILDADKFKRMKRTAIIINTSRGGLINEQDLYEALVNNTIAGAGLDVLNEEPPTFPIKLAELDNVILTPHAAFYSEEAMPELRKRAVQEVIRTLTEGQPKNWVNKNSF